MDCLDWDRNSYLALAAVVGGFFARNQLREAKKAHKQATADAYALQSRASADAHALQRADADRAYELQQRADLRAAKLYQEQIAPYVVILMDPSTVGNGVMDLVCKTFGQTVALDVQVTFDTPLQRTRPGATTPSEIR